MRIDRLDLDFFRNYVHFEAAFDPSVNVIYGDNAQGKTNLLEAIHLVSVGRSFRGAKEPEMIGFDADAASVSVDFTDSVRRQNLTLRLYRGKKRQIEQALSLRGSRRTRCARFTVSRNISLRAWKPRGARFSTQTRELPKYTRCRIGSRVPMRNCRYTEKIYR